MACLRLHPFLATLWVSTWFGNEIVFYLLRSGGTRPQGSMGVFIFFNERERSVVVRV